MRTLFAGLALTIGLLTGAAAQDLPRVASLDWLAGEWVGEGREGEGPPEGSARLYWTPPDNGAVSYLFTWTTLTDAHVHYAFSVFQDVPDGVTGKGVHYGRDFRTFESAPWRLRLLSVSRQRAFFECEENCRSRTITFSMTPDGRLEERWMVGEGRPDWVVTYRRAERNEELTR